MPVSSSESEGGEEEMVNDTNTHNDDVQQTKDMLAELGVIHDRDYSHASCLSDETEEDTTAGKAETETVEDNGEDNDQQVRKDTYQNMVMPNDVYEKLAKVDQLVEKQRLTVPERVEVPAQNNPEKVAPEEAAPGTDTGGATTGPGMHTNTDVIDLPRTSLTQNIGMRQPSEPGAIAVHVTNHDASSSLSGDIEAPSTHANHTGEGAGASESTSARNHTARTNIPFDDSLVSAYLVPSAHFVLQPDRNRNDEEEAYTVPLQVATVADSFCGNSRKYRYFMVAAIAIILVLIVVLMTTTLSQSSAAAENSNNQSTTLGSPVTDGATDEATTPPEDPSMIQQYGQTIIGSVPGDRFGAPLVWNHAGNILAIGARLNGDVGDDSGMVRIYRASNIVPPTSTSGDEQQENGSNDSSSTSTRTLWEQYGNAIFGQSPGDEFAHSGMAMSADGQRLAVGAPYRNVTVTANVTADETTARTSTLMNAAGVVRIFDYITADGWRESGPPIEGFQAGDLFGRAVAMSDDGRIVAASSYESSENGFASGNVRVFRQRQSNGTNSTRWDPMGQVLVGKAELDRLGRALDMSADGMRLVAGATQYKGDGYKPGYVQVYGFSNVTRRWDQIGQDIAGDTDQGVFGRDVAISADGTIIACGSNLANTSGLEASGLARMYQLHVDSNNTEQWMPMGQPILGTAEGDGLGASVALSADGKRVAVGAQQKKTNLGYVLVMDYDETSQQWKQSDQNNNSILTGAEELDKFGTDVQLSANGEFLAVGAIGSDLNGDDSGQVQVFNLTNIK